MKKWTTKTIGNTTFEFNTVDKVGHAPISNDDIYDCYGRPSPTKVSIWMSWSNWFCNNNGVCGICSHNSNFFSIEGHITDYENHKEYYVYITPSHNRMWEVE